MKQPPKLAQTNKAEAQKKSAFILLCTHAKLPLNPTRMSENSIHFWRVISHVHSQHMQISLQIGSETPYLSTPIALPPYHLYAKKKLLCPCASIVSLWQVVSLVSLWDTGIESSFWDLQLDTEMQAHGSKIFWTLYSTPWKRDEAVFKLWD